MVDYPLHVLLPHSTTPRLCVLTEKALATVTAIIDGMGSVGAAIGPLATGYISELPGGFTNVFLMLYGSAAMAGLLLTKLLVKEIGDLR